MGLGKDERKFYDYFVEQVKIFSKETGIEISDSFSGNLHFKIDSIFYLGSSLAERKLSKNPNLNREQLMKDAYDEALRGFIETTFRGTLLQVGPVNSNFTMTWSTDGNYLGKIKEDPKKFDQYIKAFSKFINNISIAYLKQEDLPLEYNNGLAAMDFVDMAQILSPAYGKRATNKLQYQFDVAMSRMGESEKIISDINEALNDIDEITQSLGDEEYREVLDISYEESKNMSVYVDREAKNKTKNEKMIVNIEKLATSYTALREKYHNRSFFEKWFTPTGWKESRKINELRNKMMDVFAIKSKENFNKDMESLSNKGTFFAKQIYEKVQDAQMDYDKKVKDTAIKEMEVELGLTKPKQLEISDNELNIDNVKEEKVQEKVEKVEKVQEKEEDAIDKENVMRESSI